jgi:cation diffusion facilitator family transporter
MTRTIKAAWGGLGVSVVALGLKFAAYWVTGSIALYSDALETTINVVGAVTALIALWYGERPADASHPYGHQKAEYISAAIEAFMVVATAFAIGREAYLGWWHPHAPETPFMGVLLNGASGVVNLLWALFLIRVGRRWRSPALAASGKHIMTDVWTSGGILVAFALIPLTGWLRLDPALAAIIAVNILWSGGQMLRESMRGLMDEGSDPETVADIRRIISDNRGRAIEAHDIRTRVAGNMTFLEFHLVVPGDMTVEDAHGLCDRIEAALLERLGHASITIHVEPDSQSAAARGWSNDRDAAHQITTSVGVVALEIFEDGLPPRFRLWLDPSQALEVHAIKIETVRDCGAWQRFTMEDHDGYVESIEEIPEPHTFTAYLQMGGETYAVDFVKRQRMGR